MEKDLCAFARVYMERVTPRMVKVSIGLRTPELYLDTAENIMEVPRVFKGILVKYFTEMQDQIRETDTESMAMMFLSMNFGFVFLNASFGRKLTELEKEEYIANSVHIFVEGIRKK